MLRHQPPAVQQTGIQRLCCLEDYLIYEDDQ